MDEQRSPNIVSTEQPQQRYTGESLRAEIDRLQAQYEAEEKTRLLQEAEKSPPRPVEEIALDFIRAVSGLLGNPHQLDSLVKEAGRALGK